LQQQGFHFAPCMLHFLVELSSQTSRSKQTTTLRRRDR
jgi:hypothetical protein